MKIGLRRILFTVVFAISSGLFHSTPVLHAASFNAGDVFVSLHTGQVQHRSADGTLIETLTGSPGMAEGLAFDAAGNLYVTHFFTPDLTGGNIIDKFSPAGALLGTFGSNYNCNPKSLAFATSGQVYIGQADCGRAILKLDAAGNFVSSFNA